MGPRRKRNAVDWNRPTEGKSIFRSSPLTLSADYLAHSAQVLVAQSSSVSTLSSCANLLSSQPEAMNSSTLRCPTAVIEDLKLLNYYRIEDEQIMCVPPHIARTCILNYASEEHLGRNLPEVPFCAHLCGDTTDSSKDLCQGMPTSFDCLFIKLIIRKS